MKEYTKEEILKAYSMISDFLESKGYSNVRLALIQVKNLLANIYCKKSQESRTYYENY